MGHEVSILCGKWWDGEGKVGNLLGVPIVRKLYTRGRSGISAASFTLSLLRSLPGLERYDLIEFNMSPMLHFSLLDLLRHTRAGSSAVVVGAMHEVWQEHWFRYAGPVYGSVGYFLEKTAMKKLDHVVTISNFNARKLARWKVPSSKVSVVRPGVDWEEVRNAPSSERISDIIFVGRIVESKRPDIFVQTVSELKKRGMKDVKAVVVGGGPLLGELVTMSRRLGVEENITFTGYVRRDELFSLLKSSRVFIQPTPPEGGWSITFLEANAAGLPVISSARSDIGLSSEIIREGFNGFIIPDLSASSFAVKAGELLSDRQRMKKISENSVQFASSFAWDKIASQVLDLYERLVARSHSG